MSLFPTAEEVRLSFPTYPITNPTAGYGHDLGVGYAEQAAAAGLTVEPIPVAQEPETTDLDAVTLSRAKVIGNTAFTTEIGGAQ